MKWRLQRMLRLGLVGLGAVLLASQLYASYAPLRSYFHNKAAKTLPALARPTGVDQRKTRDILDRYGKLPLSFEINEGQTDKKVSFLSRGSGYDLFLTRTDAVLSLRPARAFVDKFAWPTAGNVNQRRIIRLRMLGANLESQVEGEQELPGKVNYFVGADSRNWHSNIRTYRRVSYKSIYPGVDVVYYGNQRQLEYDFVVNPRADLKLIAFQIDGIDKLRLDATGDLVLTAAADEIKLLKPVIYQLNDRGERDPIAGHYVVNGKTVRFNVGAFDRTRPLVIDPILSYSTLIGSGGNEFANGIAVDGSGNAYITGLADNAAFPTTNGAFQTSGSFGAFVSKLNSSGTSLLYSTYLTGSGGAIGNGIAVDSTGAAHVTGHTMSADFPTLNPLRGGRFNLLSTSDSGTNWSPSGIGAGNRSVVALAVNQTTPTTIFAGLAGSGGIYKSTDGGNNWSALNTGLTGPSCAAIVIDPSNPNTVYAALSSQNLSANGVYKSIDGGATWSSANTGLPNLPVTALAIDPQTPSTLYAGSTFAFYKSTNSGATWVSSNTGINFTGFTSIVVDPVTPTTIYATAGGGGVFKTTNGGGNWSQVNTGLTSTTVRALVIDPAAPATLYAGTANGGAFKTTNGGTSWSPINNSVLTSTTAVNALLIDPTATTTLYLGTGDGRILKSTTGGAAWSAQFETIPSTRFNALAIDPATTAKIYAGADTTSFTLNNYEVFVTKLNAAGSALVYSTLLGGNGGDEAYGIALDATGNASVVGLTTSANFPTVNAIKSTFSGPDGCGDGFVTKLNSSGSAYVFSTYLGGNGCDTAYSIAADTSGSIYVTGSTRSTDFPLANAFQSQLSDSLNADAFATKLNSSGTLAFSTYLGGNGIDTGFGIAVDASGNAYITGQTASTNFPASNPIQSTNAGASGDAFVTKLNSTGSSLVYSTYLGGSDFDSGRGIAVDGAGNAYVAGSSASADFPVVAGTLKNKSPFYRSSDAGAHWGNNNYGLKHSVSVIAVHPTNPATILAGAPGAVYKSTNGGRNWTLSQTGLVTPSVASLVFDPANPSNVYLTANVSFPPGSSLGVFKSTDGGNSWTASNNGFASSGAVSIAIDPLTPTTLYASSGGRVYKTTNGGGNWAAVVPSFLNINELAIDPLTPTTIYGAANNSGGGVLKSTDGGATWQSINTGLNTPFISSVAIDPVTPSTVYAGGTQGLFKTVNGGASWTLINAGLVGVEAIDSLAPATLYAITNTGGVSKSTDGGNTWASINNGFISPLSTIAINPALHSIIYAVGGLLSDTDAFVVKVNPAGTALVYSTFVGDIPDAINAVNRNESASALAIDSSGAAYISGATFSPNFPVSPDSYQPFNRGFNDAFVAKLSMSYSINGQVVDSTNAPVSGVEVVLGDGTTLVSTVTDPTGLYDFSSLREGGNFVVSAFKPNFSITPASHTFNNLTSNQTANFTATATNAPFHVISGQITENGTALGGVTVTLSGSQSAVRTTDASGNYLFTLAGGGNYTVTPSKLAFTFAPASQVFNNLSANQTGDFAATRQNLVVTNANDHGAGSLRQAMLDANATVGPDTIVFNIPGPGVKTINLLLVLPEITDPVIIDATTQPGYANAPLVELNGTMAGASANGIVIKAGGSTIKGLVINRFSGGNALWIFSNNNTIQGNYIGLDATGTLKLTNRYGLLLSSSNNLIGGTTPAARNVISGNQFSGIEILGANNIVQGNFIGTNAGGTAAIGNSDGVNISGSAASTGNVIGGTVPGAGNLVSGNSQRGIVSFSSATVVQGNIVGTDISGTQAIGNFFGVICNASDCLVGGTVAGSRNLISGNNQGVSITGVGSKLQGNFVGTDITGTLALGNTFGAGGGGGALIGGTIPEARNIISGNGNQGNLALGVNVTVQGNFIGPDVTGNYSLAPVIQGIVVNGNNNVIGGASPSAANVISGNGEGIRIRGSLGAHVTGNIVQGNLIGVNAAGNASLQNLSGGITLENASNTTIGGPTPNAGNIIAFSGATGVKVDSGTGNVIQSNSIFSNLGLGIDLSVAGAIGVTPNDTLDADTGANNLQNWPQLTSVSASGGGTLIQGTLHSKASTTFRIDFYANSACDISGNGEGGGFFDTTNVTTDANGNATLSFTSSTSLPAGKTLTATATDPSGNTSEFSPCDSTKAAGSASFENYSYNVLEDAGAAVLNVVRTGGSKGTLSINYSSANGTATAGSDYTAVSGTLVFGDGETTKSILLPVANDGTTEPDETVRISLSSTDIQNLGFSPNTTVTLQDNNTQLFIFYTNTLFDPPDPIDAPEGNSGTTNRTVFFRLSAQTSRTVTVDFSSQGVTATSGVDFGAVSGTLTFAPNVTTRTVTVPIIGDTLDENNETFAIVLSSPVNASLGQPFATVRILDDDPLPVLTISDTSVTEGNSGTTTAVFELTLSPASGRTVSVILNTANGTATSGSDYVATPGVVSFSPGETTKTFSVTVNGETSVEADETFVVNLSPVSTAVLARTQATGTIIDDDGLRLLLEISGPAPNQAAAFDSLMFVRDPFRVLSIAEWWNLGADRNTRVIIFAVNLNPAEPASAVTVSLVDSSSQTHNITSEDVRAVPNSNLTQVRFRLPDNLPAGNCVITIKAHGQTSNAGTIRIAP